MISNINEYITYEIDDDILKRVQNRLKENNLSQDGSLSSRSYHKGGLFTGYITEEIVFKLFPNIIKDDTYTHDGILVHKGKNYPVDIKSKGQTCPKTPDLDWAVTVDDYLKEKQNPDIYIFGRVLSDKSGKALKAWLFGFQLREKFYKEAKLYKVGDKSGKITIMHEDCWTLEIKYLEPMRKLHP